MIGVAPEGQVAKRRLDIIYTTMEGTLAAVEAARDLVRDLEADLRIVVPQVVPYPLPLSHPPVDPASSGERLRRILADPGGGLRVEVYLCRDVQQMFREWLQPHSLVFVGGRHRWWRSREERLMAALSAEGHQVIFVSLAGRRVLRG